MQAPLQLPPDEIHIWQVPHADLLSHVPQLATLLNAEEHARAARYYFERDRTSFTISRAVLRLLLAGYGAAPAAAIDFISGPQGKPALAEWHGCDWLQFNLSHTQGMTVYAFARGRPVGIDVERQRPLIDATGLIQRFFAPEEQQEFLALPPESRERGFLNGWTRKEAVIKATGEGLSRSLDSFAVTLTPSDEPLLLRLDGCGSELAEWRLFDLTLDPRFVTALAVCGAQVRVRNQMGLGAKGEVFLFG